MMVELGSRWLEHQLRAHILNYRQEAERAMTHLLQQDYFHYSPQTATNWGLSIQMPHTFKGHLFQTTITHN